MSRSKHSTDPVLGAALAEDAAYLEAMGADAGPTLSDIFNFWDEPRDTPGWFDDDYEPSN